MIAAFFGGFVVIGVIYAIIFVLAILFAPKTDSTLKYEANPEPGQEPRVIIEEWIRRSGAYHKNFREGQYPKNWPEPLPPLK